ncbi:hypothetical protein Mapa_008447 [Marchantia paleacea]|nr:hypothetical protein Mapa_008447 [Marchantia paleacea]
MAGNRLLIFAVMISCCFIFGNVPKASADRFYLENNMDVWVEGKCYENLIDVYLPPKGVDNHMTRRGNPEVRCHLFKDPTHGTCYLDVRITDSDFNPSRDFEVYVYINENGVFTSAGIQKANWVGCSS